MDSQSTVKYVQHVDENHPLPFYKKTRNQPDDAAAAVPSQLPQG